MEYVLRMIGNTETDGGTILFFDNQRQRSGHEFFSQKRGVTGKMDSRLFKLTDI